MMAVCNANQVHIKLCKVYLILALNGYYSQIQAGLDHHGHRLNTAVQAELCDGWLQG
jgi:hypothetical protein